MRRTAEKLPDQQMFEYLGGEVGVFVKETVGKELICKGTCLKHLKITDEMVRGYPHTAGILDGDGERWWVYVHCLNCGYDHSYKKVRLQEECGCVK